MDRIEEVRRALSSECTRPDLSRPIFNGEIEDFNGYKKPFKIIEGWDFLIAHQCDVEWGVFNKELIDFIVAQNYSDLELKKIEKNLQLDDAHWDWLKKAAVYQGPEYKWFFLYVDEKPQSACIIYHPKKSFINVDLDIYYIEYLAAAPWNRSNPMSHKVFNGVGKITLQSIQDYCSNALGWNLGFSLHSLPKAETYYEHIGMVRCDKLDKKVNDNTFLKYYEMMEEQASIFMRGLA